MIVFVFLECDKSTLNKNEIKLYQTDKQKGIIEVLCNEDEKNQKIEVSNVQGRVYKNEEEESLNYITSWQSNKPTISSVEYVEDEKGDIKKVKESSYSYIHNIVFPKVDFSSVYKYIIKSQDRWGNEVQTGEYVFYTGPEEISFFKLLEKSLLESFGWMASR